MNVDNVLFKLEHLRLVLFMSALALAIMGTSNLMFDVISFVNVLFWMTCVFVFLVYVWTFIEEYYLIKKFKRRVR